MKLSMTGQEKMTFKYRWLLNKVTTWTGLTVYSMIIYLCIEGHYNASNPAATKYRDQGGYFRFVNVLSELDEPVSLILSIWYNVSDYMKEWHIITS